MACNCTTTDKIQKSHMHFYPVMPLNDLNLAGSGKYGKLDLGSNALQLDCAEAHDTVFVVSIGTYTQASIGKWNELGLYHPIGQSPTTKICVCERTIIQ